MFSKISKCKALFRFKKFWNIPWRSQVVPEEVLKNMQQLPQPYGQTISIHFFHTKKT